MVKTSLPPGFRFHPTDVELVWYYLKRKITGKPSRFEAISEVQLYKFAPWDLPDKSCLLSKDLEWYFFCPRDRKYSHGSRTNRATDIGYWKPTGRDRTIVYNSQKVGMKKTLVFHLGKSPKGTRTNWVMYEFRLESSELANAGYTQDACVLCKIFEKSGRGPKNGEQYGAPFKEEDWEDDTDIEDDGSFPCRSSAGGARLFYPSLMQSVAPEVDEPLPPMPSNFEVGEPSSMQSHFEVGEPSAMACNLEVGEPSSMIGNFDVVEPSSMTRNFEVGEPSSNVPEPYADGISLEEVETFLLDSSPSHSENVNAKTLNSGILHEDVVEMPDVDFEDIYRDFFGLSDPPYLEPADGIIALSDILGADHHIQPEFADEHYVEIFNDYTHKLSIDNLESDVDGYFASELQLKDHLLPEDQLPATLEYRHLPK